MLRFYYIKKDPKNTKKKKKERIWVVHCNFTLCSLLLPSKFQSQFPNRLCCELWFTAAENWSSQSQSLSLSLSLQWSKQTSQLHHHLQWATQISHYHHLTKTLGFTLTTNCFLTGNPSLTPTRFFHYFSLCTLFSLQF